MLRILFALILALAPLAAHAQLLTTGAGKGGSSGGGGAFTPGATHFDWATSTDYVAAPLTVGGTPVAATQHLTFSVWVRGTPTSAAMSTSFRPLTSGFVDFVSGFDSISSEATGPFDLVFDNAAPGGYKTLRANSADGVALAPNDSHTCNVPQTATSNVQSDAWTHIAGTIDGSATGTNTKTYKVWINGTKVNDTCTYSFTTGVYSMINNVLGFGIMNQATNNLGTLDLSEVFVDFTLTMADADIAKFIDGSGKPVDLGTNCATPLGRTPEICRRGAGAAFGVNGGSVTNTFTQSGLYVAPYGPGGPPANTAYVQCAYGEATAPVTTTVATVSTGCGVLAGDLIFQVLTLTDSSGVTDHLIQTPAGYTLGKYTVPVAATGETSAVYYKVAATNGESDAVTLNWTGAATHAGFNMTLIVRGAPAVSPVDAIDSANTGPSTTYTAPSLTATATNDLLLSIFTLWGTGYAITNMPANQVRVVSGASPSSMKLLVNSETIAATGATGTRSMTSSSDGATAYSILIKHN